MRLAIVMCAVTVFVNVLHGPEVHAAERTSLMEFLPPGQVLSARPHKDQSLDLNGINTDTLSSPRAVDLLQKVMSNAALATRGAREAQLYREISPSVVLVVTDFGLGSGSVIGAGQVLTSNHVIAGARDIGVIFKPSLEGREPTTADVIRATVIRSDPVTDLAIISYPTSVRSVKAIELGTQGDIEVGGDVSAIGHPTGEAWTYTKGIISQYRKNYNWKMEDKIDHHADVVQTQTPINPGNSGGPLLTNAGKLIGVNAFKSEGEGLNFAIAVTTIRQFLSSQVGQNPSVKSATRESKCEPKILYEGRDKANTAFIRLIDMWCTGAATGLYRLPDDKKRSIAFLMDTAGAGTADIELYDWDRDGKWDYSLISTKRDGKIDLIGHHPDGKVKPTWFEAYHGQPTPWAN